MHSRATIDGGGRGGFRTPWPDVGERAAVATIIAAGACLAFRLPWHVPVRTAILSDSAVVGFNNGAATLAVGATLMALLGTRLAFARPGDRSECGPLLEAPAPTGHAERIVLPICIAISVMVVVGWWRFIPSSYFGEAAYFLPRLDMMMLGLRPYRDFDYGYGPGLLLFPAALHRCSGGSVPIDTAYIATVAGHHAVGLAMAAALLRRLAGSDGVRAGILLFVAAASLNITLGVIYTPLRFMYAAWASLAFDRATRDGPSWGRSPAACLLSLGGWLLSPDVGLGTSAALAAGILFESRATPGETMRRLLAVGAAPAGLLAIHGPHLLGLLVAFGGGALNLPLLPAPYVLAFLGSTVAVIPALGAVALRGGRLAPLTASLAVALGMAIPGALGRCDPGHVISSGLPLLVVALAWSWSGTDGRKRTAALVAALVMLATHGMSTWNHQRHLVERECERRATLARFAGRFAAADRDVIGALGPGWRDPGWGKRLPFPAAFLDLCRYPALATPVATVEDIDRFLKATGRYVPLRHVPPSTGLVDEAAADRIAADALSCAHIMVPTSALSQPPPMGTWREAGGRALEELILFPLDLDIVNPPWDGIEAVMRRIRRRFRVVGEFHDYSILSRIDDVPSAGGR